MYIMNDYTCASCSRTEERLVDSKEVDTQVCEACGSKLSKEPPAAKTHFHFTPRFHTGTYKGK